MERQNSRRSISAAALVRQTLVSVEACTKRLTFLAVLLAAMALPAGAAIDYFPAAGAGSFDTYSGPDSPYDEGYTNGGSLTSPRLGSLREHLGWLAWDAKNSSAVETVSHGDTSGQNLSQFISANGGVIQTATLYINLLPATNLGTATWAIETIRCGNTGVIQADAGLSVAGTYSSPAGSISGSTQPYAWLSGPGPWTAPGILNASDAVWVAAPPLSGQSSTITGPHYAAQFTNGLGIKFPPVGTGYSYGYDLTMNYTHSHANPWALASLLGMDSSQAGTNMANATAAGQIVNNDGAGNAVYLMQSQSVGASSPRPGSASGNWYAVPLSADLVASLATDPYTKGLILNNWFGGGGTTPATITVYNGGGTQNPQFYGPNQSAAANAYIVLTVVGPGALSVTPTTGLTSTGPVGGPFSPTNTTYTLTNTGGQSLHWTAADTGSSWLTLSKTSGDLLPGTPDTVTVTINSAANSLAADPYSDTVTFTNTTNGTGNTTRLVNLTVTMPPSMFVTPGVGLTTTAAIGGPVAPDSEITYTLTNTGGQPLHWTASKLQPWVTLSKTTSGATPIPPGEYDTVTVSINSGADNLGMGLQPDTITFTNTDNNIGNATRAVSSTVQALVFLQQPSRQTVSNVDTLASFSVTPAGTAEIISCQWYKNGGVQLIDAPPHIQGSTLSVLNINSPTQADQGDYYAVVTSDLGPVTSAKASLTISPFFFDIWEPSADGSMDCHPAEGYAISGEGGLRLSKGNEHFGFMAFNGPSDGPDGIPLGRGPDRGDGVLLKDWLGGKKAFAATLYLRIADSQTCDPSAPQGTYLNDPVEIIGFRCANAGLLTDRGTGPKGTAPTGADGVPASTGFIGCCATFDDPLLEGGESTPSAWRMGKPYVVRTTPPATGYSALGDINPGDSQAEYYKVQPWTPTTRTCPSTSVRRGSVRTTAGTAASAGRCRCSPSSGCLPTAMRTR